MLLVALETHMRETPHAPALTGADRTLTWQQLHDAVNSTASEWQQKGIHRLALALENGPEWVIADLACLKAGIVTIPVPDFFSQQQLEWLLESSGADAQLGGSPQPGWRTDSCELGTLRRRFLAQPPALPSGTAKITFTSGTTAAPKGVCLSRSGMTLTARALSNKINNLAIARHLVTLPLATLMENLCGVYVPLLLGVEMVVLPAAQTGFNGSGQFDTDVFQQALQQWQPQSLVLVPELLRMMMLIASRCPQAVAELQFVAVGGGKIAPALLLFARALGLPIYEGYGLAECGSVVAINTPNDDLPGSVGRPLPGIQLALGDKNELLVSSSSQLLGYLGEAPHHGVVCTGDAATIDEQGYLHITGRIKNIQVNAFGRNFSPEWIEAEAMLCPAVIRVVVFGNGLVTNVALVHARAGEEMVAREQLRVLSARLPDYAAIPTLIFTEGISSAELLTANGRPRRSAIYKHFGPLLQRASGE